MKKWIYAVVVIILIGWGIYFWLPPSYEHPESYKINNFPVLEQPDEITCGPTSCVMLLQYYGKNITINQAKKQTKTEWFEHNGEVFGMTSPEFIAITMKHFKVPAKMKRGSLKSLKYYISQNRPPIVLLRNSKEIWHYVIAIGYDKESIIIADPGWGVVRSLKTKIFLKAWDFSSDMTGSDTTDNCFICGGDGQVGLPGQLGKCDFCEGVGKIDFFRRIIELADVQGNTYTVPEESQK